VRPEQKQSASFVRRSEHCLRSVSIGKPQPDYLVLFGCTNDNWIGRDAGAVLFSDWTEQDLELILPAYCYVLDRLTKENPASKIICVINTNFRPEVHNGMLAAADHYGAAIVTLQNIDKSNGHPTKLGMSQIAAQIGSAII
jgi:hypothetical protein